MASRTGPASNPVNNTIVDLSFAALDKTRPQATLLDLFKHILERPGYSLQTTKRLEKCIRNGAISAVALGDTDRNYEYNLWTVITAVVRCIPPDHLWQDIIAAALQRLQEGGGHVGGLTVSFYTFFFLVKSHVILLYPD